MMGRTMFKTIFKTPYQTTYKATGSPAEFVAKLFIGTGVAFIIPLAVWSLFRPAPRAATQDQVVSLSQKQMLWANTYLDRTSKRRIQASPPIGRRQLQLLWQGIGELAGDKKYSTQDLKLTREQSQQLAALIESWQDTPEMRNEQVKQLYRQLNGLLTERQRHELSTIIAAKQEQHSRTEHRTNPLDWRKRIRFKLLSDLSDSQELEMTCQWMQKITVFITSVNPFYPPETYSGLAMLPDRKQQQMKVQYLECHKALERVQLRAQL